MTAPLLLAALLSVAPGETVSFRSGDLVLQGTIYKPQGAGPFSAVVYNHGSAPGMMSKQAFDAKQDGHSFGYFGGDVWNADVFAFLAKHCRGAERR